MVLNLEEGNTLANAMDSPGRYCVDISGSHTDTVHQVMKIFSLDPLQDLLRGDPVLKAQVYPASRPHGQDMPYLEMEAGFTVDGTRYKARLDYGVDAVDYRGAVTDAGA